jgi:hypothetical protein
MTVGRCTFSSQLKLLLAGPGPIALALGLAAGCAGRFTNGGETTYTGAIWVPVVLLVFGVLCVLAGCLFRGHEFPLSARVALAVVGAGMALFGAPGLLAEKATVGPDHFEIRSGFWLRQTTKTVRFDDLVSIELVTIRGRRTTSYELKCVLKTGATEAFAIGDALTEATPEIMARAIRRGIRVDGLLGGRLPFVFGPLPDLDEPRPRP